MLNRHVRSRITGLLRNPNESFPRHSSSKTRALKLSSFHDSSPRSTYDLLTPSRVALLNLTLTPYIPEKLLPFPSPDIGDTLPPAYHFIFFPTSTSEVDTLRDGYEKHFAPSYPFSRRLWTQGRIVSKREGLKLGQRTICKEKLENIIEGKNATDVWISRKFYPVDHDFVNIENQDGEDDDRWTLKETRCLRYLRHIPRSSAFNRSFQSPPSIDFLKARDRALLTHTFTPTEILLTRYSHLTFNFHKIHTSPSYAKNVEMYPNVVVHGSLSITLILTILRQCFSQKMLELRIQGVKYVMYRPLYVGQKVTLTITESERDNVDKKIRHRAILWTPSFEKAVECIIYPYS